MVVLIVEYGPKPCSNYSGPYVRARTRVGTAVCCGFSNWGFGVLKLRLHSLLLSGCWALKDPGVTWRSYQPSARELGLNSNGARTFGC